MRNPLFRSIVAAFPLLTGIIGAGAKAQIVATIDHTGQYARRSEADVLPRLIAAGQLRRATPAEMARIARANPVLMQRTIPGDPIYVLMKPVAHEDLGEFSGANSRTFIVSPTVRQRDFGRGHSNFVTPSGACLQGACGDCSPTANAAYRSGEIPNTCMAAIPAAPPAPPALPRR